MQTQIRKIGNSKGAVIPAQILKQLDIKEGDHLNINTDNGCIVIKPVTQKKKYQLADLLAKCDDSAPMPEALVEWDNAEPVGNEV